MFNDVVVGVDFGPASPEAIALAQSLLAPRGRLTLAHVVMSDPRVFGASSAGDVAQERALSVALLERERSLVFVGDHAARGGEIPQVRILSLVGGSAGR